MVPVIQPSREKAKETPLVVLQHVIVASEVAVQANSPLVAVCPISKVSCAIPMSPLTQNRPDLVEVATRVTPVRSQECPLISVLPAGSDQVGEYIWHTMLASPTTERADWNAHPPARPRKEVRCRAPGGAA